MIAMRRLIEGLDELAGHDVVMARDDQLKRQTISVVRRASLLVSAFWSLIHGAAGRPGSQKPAPPRVP